MTTKIKRHLLELSIWVSVIAILFLTGWQVELAAFVQRAVVSTGIIQAKSIQKQDQTSADYDYTLIDENGDLFELSDHKDKVIFMNYWATWCPPCLAEMPSIQSLYEQVRDENIIFVMINVDDDFEKAKTMKSRKEYSFPIFQSYSSVPSIFGGQSIPRTFVISPSGKIIVKKESMAKYDTEAFQKILREAR